MADWNEVRRLALFLPVTSERESRGNVQWRVKDRLFVWERPLRKPDLKALGDRAPKGPVLGVMVADLGEKEALLAGEPGLCSPLPISTATRQCSSASSTWWSNSWSRS